MLKKASGTKGTISKLTTMLARPPINALKVLLSPFGVLYYLNGTTERTDFICIFRSSKVTTHNLAVLLNESSTE
jgi:hypothetical protein